MANFRRHKPRNSCSAFTGTRWLGNAKGRFKEQEEEARHRGVLADEVEPAPATVKSPKRNWSRNKRVRSLEARLVHLTAKRDEFAKKPLVSRWGRMILDDYDKEIAQCEQELVELGMLV